MHVSFSEGVEPWPHCVECVRAAGKLCDFPVGNDKTCDRHLCESCANNVGPEIDYCKAHWQDWKEFKDSGGLKAELENVVPFKST